MKIINSREELLEYTGNDDMPYDVDANWIIWEMDYEYPIMLDHTGDGYKGTGYKVYTKKDIDVLKQFIQG